MWAQGIAAFILWVLYGVWLSLRKTRFSAAWHFFPTRGQRIGLSIVALIVSVLLFGGGLALLTYFKQVTSAGFTALGFVGLVFLGVLFVYLQCLAAATMIALVLPPVTEPDPKSSDEGSTL